MILFPDFYFWQIEFQANKGGNQNGYIAIDDVSFIEEDHCDIKPKQADPSLTTTTKTTPTTSTPEPSTEPPNCKILEVKEGRYFIFRNYLFFQPLFSAPLKMIIVPGIAILKQSIRPCMVG